MILDDYLQLAGALQKACEVMSGVPGSSKLKRLIHKEAAFLRTLSEKKETEQAAQLSSSNLNHYAAIVDVATHLPGVTYLLHPFSSPTCPSSSELGKGPRTLVVDVVAAEGGIWMKVVARKSKALHLAWLGQGQSGERDVAQQAEEYLACAACHVVNFKPPSLHIAFYGGVTHPLSEALSQRGVTVWGNVVDVDAQLSQELRGLQYSDTDSSSGEDDEAELDRVSWDGDLECDGDGTINDSGRWEHFSMAAQQKVMTTDHEGIDSCRATSNAKMSSTDIGVSESQELVTCKIQDNKCEKPGSRNDESNSLKFVEVQSSPGTSTGTVLLSKLFGHGTSLGEHLDTKQGMSSSGPVANSQKQAQFILEESFLPRLLTHQPDFSRFNMANTRNKGKEEVVAANLDITALICLVSSLCNGNCNLHFPDIVLDQQAAQERASPVLPPLRKFLEGKKLVVCRTALQGFQSILAMTAGPKERERAEKLMRLVRVVDDQPSPRTLRLKCQGRVKDRSKIIFGTGDTIHAVTVTANTGFARAADNQGVSFAVHVHQARALTEQKELNAIPL